MTSLRDILLHETTSNYEVEATRRIHFSLSRSVRRVLLSDFLSTLQSEELTIYSCILWQQLAGPFLCCHFWLLFSLSTRKGQSRGASGGAGGGAATSAAPLSPSLPNFCCPALWNLNLMQKQRMVIHVQQVPVPWKPPFCPQNIPFYPFWRPVTGKTRHHTTPGQAVTKPIFCLLLDWLKKTF